jgi:hypothetical protein
MKKTNVGRKELEIGSRRIMASRTRAEIAPAAAAGLKS